MTNLFVPQIAVVDFHHARGPEIEFWVQPIGTSLFQDNDWSLLPFFALADGAHAVEEEFSYFTLLQKGKTDDTNTTATTATAAVDRSLFGIACMRQIKSDALKVRSPDVTRSTVQKAVVIILERPGRLGEVRERLSAVTAAWFAQKDFTNVDILQEFQDSLTREAATRTDEPEHYIGLSIREMIYEFRHQTLVLFKALLLQKKMLFFGSRCERLCLLQFALISLIPNLMRSLQDCADPALDTYAKTITRAVSLRTSERNSLLAYMGLPLQIFGTSSFFSPYTPLQLLDVLMAASTHSFVVGSTNNLLLLHKDRYTDVLVNLDEDSLHSKVQIIDPTLRHTLSLSAADRRWIDNITQTVLDTWDPENPSRPNTHGYSGSEDAIRLQFEEYLLSLCSSSAYKTYYDANPPTQHTPSNHNNHTDTHPDPLITSNDFNADFLASWRTTSNYALFDRLTRDASIFDVIDPKHPTAGGLGIEDVQRRLAQGVAELHLDHRVREGRETVGRVFEGGRERVGAGVARFWKEVEGFRERRDQSRSRDEKRAATTDTSMMKENITNIDTKNVTTSSNSTDPSSASPSSSSPKRHHSILHRPHIHHASTAPPSPSSAPQPPTSTATSSSPLAVAATNTSNSSWLSGVRDRASKIQRPEINTTQIGSAARDNAARAGAYLSSWGSWARERSKDWGDKEKEKQGEEGG